MTMSSSSWNNPLIPVLLLSGLMLSQTALAETPSPNQKNWAPDVRTIQLQSSSGAPAGRVQRAIGSPTENTTSYDIWPLSDGFIITGSVQDPETGDQDVAILKVDREGGLVWAKRFGGPAVEIGFGVRTSQNGTIVVAGWTQSFGAGQGDYYVLGLDPNGELKFENTFGHSGEERAVSLIAARDGGSVIIGETYSFGAGDSRFYLVKLDSEGRLEWEQSYDGGPLNERGLAIVEAGDGFLLIGNSMDTTSGSTATVSDGFVVRVDGSGLPLWSQRYGGEEHDIFHHVAPLPNGEFLLTGYSRGFGARGQNDIWLVKIDGSGNTMDSRIFGGDGPDHNIIARTASDGGVFLGGYTRSQGAGGWDAQILRLSPAGEVEWDHWYGSTGDDGAVALSPSGNRELAVAGYTSHPSGVRSLLFMILDLRQ